MRGFASYLVAGMLVVLAMDLIAPPAGFGLAVNAWPAVQHEPILQDVDRTHKADRLNIPRTIGKEQRPNRQPSMMVGCDPVFSPLSASAHANSPGRCVV